MQCFKSAWIHVVLHNGFFVDEQNHRFKSLYKINGEEVQWALGAMIYQMRYFPLLKSKKRVFFFKYNKILKIALKLFFFRKLNNLNELLIGWTTFYIILLFILIIFLYLNIKKSFYKRTLLKKTSYDYLKSLEFLLKV